jgi:hypothetical protein
MVSKGFVFRLAVLAAIVTLSAAARPASAGLMGGNAVIPRGSILDQFTNFSIVDKNVPINATGSVSQWSIFAGATTPVELLIYRQSGSAYSLVGSSPLVTPTLGLNTFILTSPIAVNAGDLVGYYTQGAGVAEFDLNPPGSFAFGNLSGTMLFTGNNSGLANATNFVDSSNRTYSIDVVGTAGIAVPDPSTLVLLSVGAVGLIGYDWRRRKAAA